MVILKSSIVEGALGLLGIGGDSSDLSESDKRDVGKDLEDLMLSWSDIYQIKTGYSIGDRENLDLEEESGLIPGIRLCVEYNLARISALRFGRELTQDAIIFSSNCFTELKCGMGSRIPKRGLIYLPRGMVETGIYRGRYGKWF